MQQPVFKLYRSIVAMQSENRALVTIPARASVELVSGDISAKGVVTIRYRNQPLQILAVDLRVRSSLEKKRGRTRASAQ